MSLPWHHNRNGLIWCPVMLTSANTLTASVKITLSEAEESNTLE